MSTPCADPFGLTALLARRAAKVRLPSLFAAQHLTPIYSIVTLCAQRAAPAAVHTNAAPDGAHASRRLRLSALPRRRAARCANRKKGYRRTSYHWPKYVGRLMPFLFMWYNYRTSKARTHASAHIRVLGWAMFTVARSSSSMNLRCAYALRTCLPLRLCVQSSS